MPKEKIKYSNMELIILDNIPRDGRKISTIDLATQCYPLNKKPFNARQSILAITNRLIQKSDENKEEWEIFKSNSKGTQPAYLWIEPRKRSEQNDEQS